MKSTGSHKLNCLPSSPTFPDWLESRGRQASEWEKVRLNDHLEQARLMRCMHDWPVYHLKHMESPNRCRDARNVE